MVAGDVPASILELVLAVGVALRRPCPIYAPHRDEACIHPGFSGLLGSVDRDWASNAASPLVDEPVYVGGDLVYDRRRGVQTIDLDDRERHTLAC